MTTAAVAIAVFAVIELALAAAIFWLRASCPWLITGQDACPKQDPRGLKSFLEHGWDAELGWVRKPGTSGTERGRLGVTTTYHIDASGARLNPGFDDHPPAVLAYGDSYTFARQVNDDQTWAHFLSNALGKNVANFGVGNYGFDQALLRLEREFDSHPAPVVIIGIVPETMSRIHAYWKHYSEYGNTFAFKPRFILKDRALVLKANKIDTVAKFAAVDEYRSSLAQGDYFYEKKFKRDILTFPYSLSALKNPRRTFRLLAAALSDRIGLTNDAAFVQVMRRNIQMTKDLYRDPHATALFKAIVYRFAAFCTERGAKPVLLILPQRMDIESVQNGEHYYQGFMDDLSPYLTVVDASKALLATPNLEPLFINDHYGGHLSTIGNQLVAHQLETVCKKLLADNPGAVSSSQT